MEDDEDGRKSHRRSCGRHCEQARRLMRVSTVPISENTFENGDVNDRPIRDFQREELSSTNKKDKKKKDKNKKDESEDPNENCDDEYMLQNLHKLKRFLRRVWNYAWCYTQYCYPGLRTAEYYKKVKRVCQEREKAKKKEKRDKKKEEKKKDKKKDDKKKLENKQSQIEPVFLSTATNSLMSDNSTQTSDESDWSDLDGSNDENGDDDASDSSRRPKSKPLRHLVKPLKIIPVLEQELGWGQYVMKCLRQLSETISNFIDETDQEYQIGAMVKVVCALLAPAVMLLGVNYIFLKRKYKSLSGKLRRIKVDNEILKKENDKLETMLLSTEKLKMPFSTKESRQQVVAEFTRLAESRMKSKKEITRLTTEKQALMEELRMAKKQRDAARNQYFSLTKEITESKNSQYVQT